MGEDGGRCGKMREDEGRLVKREDEGSSKGKAHFDQKHGRAKGCVL